VRTVEAVGTGEGAVVMAEEVTEAEVAIAGRAAIVMAPGRGTAQEMASVLVWVLMALPQIHPLIQLM